MFDEGNAIVKMEVPSKGDASDKGDVPDDGGAFKKEGVWDEDECNNNHNDPEGHVFFEEDRTRRRSSCITNKPCSKVFSARK